jgi:hypothetical protein
MIALWSRVSLSPGTYRYAAGVSNANATASANASRCGLQRGAWVTGSSTLASTTLLAAGLTVDAKAKLDKNVQWAEAFAQLQHALDNPSMTAKHGQEQQHSALPQSRESSVTGPMLEDADSQALHHPARMETGDNAASHEYGMSQFDAAARTWDDLRLDSRLPGAQALPWPPNTGRDMTPHHLPPQSLWSPDTLRLSALRRRHTRKKLAMQELATGFLVHNLIRHVRLPRASDKIDRRLARLSPCIRHIAAESDTEAEAARTAYMADIEQLHVTHVSSSDEHIARARTQTTHLTLPSYVQDADGDFYQICEQMNQGIAQLLGQCGKGHDAEKPFIVAKICHNLLVSTSAPDLHTFNTLIAGFTLWHHSQLVDDVIAALLASKIRPNELLCAQILRHYTIRSRPDDFSRFVARMRGVGDALTLANPGITLNEASQNRLVRINEDKVYQKVHPTPMVFAALIDGVMNFAGFDRALDVYYEMKADGWGLALPALTKLLADCIRRVDWEGGTYVWEEINSIKARVKPSYVARAYYHMLSLCSVTGNTTAFNQVLNEVAKRGFDQKSIINAAIKTTRWAQNKRDNIAPAWAADNVMIAVSGYVNDAKLPSDLVDDRILDDTEFGDSAFAQEMSQEGLPRQPSTGLPTNTTDIDTEEAWSSWVEHELGKRPKDS